MDLLDFEAKDLYFQQEDSQEVQDLIKSASELYASGEAELPLLQAYLKVIIMIKHKSDPFLAQASAMLVILFVMYVLGGDSGNPDHLIAAR